LSDFMISKTVFGSDMNKKSVKSVGINIS